MRRRLRAAQPGAGQQPQRLRAPGLAALAPSSWRSPSYGRQLLPGLAAGTPPPRRAGADTVVATSYLLGVSTRRVEKLVETLGVTRVSKSQVSEMAKSLRWLP
jgi:Transposase, Mutator family